MTRFILGVLVWLAYAGVAFAQGNCASREVVLERLHTQYGETRQSVGLVSGGSVLEVFASLETGTWSILVTAATGLSCLVASGMHFEHVPEEIRQTGEPL